jgi:hypothetical protein
MIEMSRSVSFQSSLFHPPGITTEFKLSTITAIWVEMPEFLVLKYWDDVGETIVGKKEAVLKTH